MSTPNASNTQCLLILDSIGYVAQPNFEIEGQVIVSGSHGGTAAAGYILDHPQKPKLVFFNDAGGGKDGAGMAGLELLQNVLVAACTYSHLSARIGQAQDGLDNGVISHCNGAAVRMGLTPGTRVRIVIDSIFQTSRLAPGAQAASLYTEPDPLGPPLRKFRDPNYQAQAINLADLRTQIDDLDESIIALLAKRAMLVKDAARFKADHYQVAAPQRQAEVFSKARQRAMRHNPGFEGFEDVVEQGYRTLVAQFIAKEACYFDQLIPIEPKQYQRK
jgi:isochorismate pyruvate lyase